MILQIKKYGSLISTLVILLNSCIKNDKNEKVKSSSEKSIEYIYDNGQDRLNIVMDKNIERAVLLTPYVTEMALEIGVEDKIVLGSTTEGGILPRHKKTFDALPNKMLGHHFHITKEAFLLMEPDFVSGFPEDIRAETTGAPKELINKNIYPFLLEAVNIQNATLNDVFKDIERLGEVFRKDAKADIVIKEQKKKLNEAKLIKPLSKKKKAMVMYYPFANGVWVYSSLVTDLINRAYGENVFSDIESQYELVSYESILDRNPDVIFVVTLLKDANLETEIRDLKSHPVLKNVKAVQEENIHSVKLEDVYPSIRNVDFIIKMNDIFYK